MTNEEILISRIDGVMSAKTWDSNGQAINYEMSPAELDFCGDMLSRARALRPAWDIEKIEMEEARAELDTQKRAAETRAYNAEKALKERNQQMIDIISGGTATVSDELINSFAPWQENLSVDEGDVYAYQGVLYIALIDHVTNKDNRPDIAPTYWRSGKPPSAEPGTPGTPGTRYTKGQVIEWSGVQYRALKDTDKGPGEAPGDWGLEYGDD